MTKAEEIIDLQKREESNQANFRSMWQSTAELQFPRDSAITTTYLPGTSKTEYIYDTTAIDDSKIMADGLLSALIPAGEFFFRFNVSNDNPGGVTEEYKSYLDRATDKQHRSLFASNYMLMMGETLRSLIVFGTGNEFSEWTKKTGLNFKDYDIGRYQALTNSAGRIDTMILEFPFTARQAVQEFGEENVGKSVIEAFKNEKKINEVFWFIHLTRPREKRDPRMDDFMNFPFESIYVGIKDKNIIDEGGYEEFPYHVPRWATTSGEVYGRGIGTEIQPQVRMLQQGKSDFNELGNKQANPPHDVLEGFEGEYSVVPGAVNIVTELPSAQVVPGMQGNFVHTKDTIEMERDVVHKAYYRDVWAQFTDLKGDRRTTVEIRARQLEGLRRVGQPVGRIQSELLEPQMKRVLRLLIRNGEIPPPPPGLELIEIEYLGLMSNALSSGQAQGAQQAIGIAIEMDEVFPGAKDNFNADEIIRDIARSLGTKSEHLNTPEQRDEIRQQRAEQMQKQQMLEMAQAGAKAYKDVSGAPEEGSLAGELQNA